MATIQTDVHRVRFYVPDTLMAIESMAYDDKTERLAVGRRALTTGQDEDEETNYGIVEVWDTRNAPFVEQRFYEEDSDPAIVSSLAWGPSGRLFSCGLNGNVNEYDMDHGCIKKSLYLNGGPVWCMAMNGTQTLIAAGCNDGSICQMDVSSGKLLEYKKVGQISSRVLCVEFLEHIPGKLVVGTLGSFSIVDTKTRSLVDTIQLADNCVVWSIATYDTTIITGDSAGFTSFWDSKMATLIKKYQSHESSVLAVAVSQVGLVYSSGIDPVIAQFDASEASQLPPIHAHTNDVQAITVGNRGQIYSGGKDVDLVRTIIRPKTTVRFGFDGHRLISFFGDLLKLQYQKKVEVFKLDPSVTSTQSESGGDALRNNIELPTKVASVKSNTSIIASVANENWIIYSCFGKVKFINYCDNEIKKVASPEVLNSVGDGVIETIQVMDKETIVACSSTTAHLISLSNPGQVKVTASATFERRIVNVASNSSTAAIALANNDLIVLKKSSWIQFKNVLRVSAIPTVMRFNPFDGDILYICTSDKKLIKSDLKTDCSHDLSRIDQDQYFRGIMFTPTSAIVSTSCQLFSFDPQTLALRKTISDFKNIFFVDLVTSKNRQQVVVVEVTDDQMFQLLPPAFRKKVFGGE